MSLFLLSCGANYVGETAELPDCALDAESVTIELERFIKSGKELINEAFSRRRLVSALKGIYEKYRTGDCLIGYYSGHGTTDIVDGKVQQAIVFNDLTLMWEVELRALLARFNQAVWIADCCHSAGLARGTRKARSLPIGHCFRHEPVKLDKKPPAPQAIYLACRADEYAMSTGHGGAFTLAMLEAFREREDATTFEGLFKGIKKRLPNADYSQRPAFVCKSKAFARRSLKSFNRTWNKKPR